MPQLSQRPLEAQSVTLQLKASGLLHCPQLQHGYQTEPTTKTSTSRKTRVIKYLSVVLTQILLRRCRQAHLP